MHANDSAAQQQYDAELRAIANDARVQRAFRAIEQDAARSRAQLIELTEIPAPPFGEERRAARFAEMLREAGADSVWIDEEGNVLAVRRGRGGGRTVALDGHLDTVFPESTDVKVRVRGDTLFAPGIGDDTRGLVTVLEVLRAMAAADVRAAGDVYFIGTVGEEGLGDLRGIKHILDSGRPRVDAWVAVDGGGHERIVHRGVGSNRYKITFRGPGGHSWGAFGLVNPHHALGRAIAYFAAAADTLTRRGERASYNVGRIGGGTSVNAIPFESWMEVDMRSEDASQVAAVDSALQRAVRRALEEENALRRSGDPLTVDVERVGQRPSGVLDPETPLVQRAMAATRVIGGEPGLGSGSTNANYPISLGLPSITIGRGGEGGEAHALGEWWLDRNTHLATKKALLIVLAEAGFAPVS
jgi:acetylornithine deacetylase/succinyl-diaminopimelate desuccinylase-like protein